MPAIRKIMSKYIKSASFSLAMTTSLANAAGLVSDTYDSMALFNPPVGHRVDEPEVLPYPGDYRNIDIIRSAIGMGIPRGNATFGYWSPVNATYKTSAAWNYVSPWFVIYPGANHDKTCVSNASVKVSGIGLYVLSRSTQTWG
ncbi:MAG: hypothetical protein ABL933_16015 [Methyloglobulus sp.]|nr:hypothetical protein [Methyloglobulus sp.]